MRIACIGYPLLHRKVYQGLSAYRDHEIHIVVPPGWPGFDNPPRGLGPHVSIHHSRTLFRRGIILVSNQFSYIMLDTRKIIEGVRPDIIWTQAEPWSFTCYLTARIAQQLGIPHVPFTFENIRKEFPFPFGKMERYSISRASGIVAGNSEAREICMKKGAGCPIEVMPPTGVDTEYFSPKGPDLRKKLGLVGKKVVLFSGRFMDFKGIMQVLESIPQVSGSITGVSYLLCGRGPFERQMRRYISQKKLPCTIISWISHGDMPRLYRTADVFVYPSYATKIWKEQFGWANLEAMCCGIPVITTRSGSIPEVVGDAAFMVNEKDTQGLADAVIKVLSDQGLSGRLARAGFRQAGKFSYQVIGKRHIDFFKRILKK
ncbi:MAG: glycosyltransferase family 4 protein [archaeon]